MTHYSELDFSKIKIRKNKIKHKGGYVTNCPMAFDIETTSVFLKNGWKAFDNRYPQVPDDFYKDCKKMSWCYIWMFGFINDFNKENEEYVVVCGRTLEEFKHFICKFQNFLDSKIIIYSHNLSFEFQYLRNIFDDLNVFARKKRKVMKCDCMDGLIEFKCSLILSGLSLEKTAELNNKKYMKKSGDLDYRKVRFSDTELTTKEMGYCEFDILSLLEYIKIEASYVRFMCQNIPLTKTSKVRKKIKKLYDKDKDYHKRMQNCVPQVECQKLLMKTYTGATTHANPLWVGYVCRGLHCKDLSSSYPTVLISEKYPCSPFFKLNTKDFDKINRSKYAYFGTFTFKNIKAKTSMNYISCHKCNNEIHIFSENGKVQSAEQLTISLTDVDVDIIKQVYDFDKMICSELYIAKKDYLDIRFVELILDFYFNKTTLKGETIENLIILYKQNKEYINSLYGCCVTNLIGNLIEFFDDWKETKLTDDLIEELLVKQKTSRNTVLQYSTGVWCTAYARQRLWLEGILPLGRDLVYTDTDSVKYFERNNKYKRHFHQMNKQIFNKLKKGCRGRKDLIDKLIPKDKKGNVHQLGIWDDEGVCDLITWGAKKYMTKHGNDLEVTVSGLNKKLALTNPYLNSLDDFKKGLKFDVNQSGRKILYYLDEQEPTIIDGHIIDYRYGIVIQPTTYTLGITDKYDEFLIENSFAYSLDAVKDYF